MSERIGVGNDNNLEGNVETQDRFNYAIVPSLKHLSTACIVSTIYKHQHTLEIIQQEGNEDEKLTEIVDCLRQKLSLLPLPSSTMEKSLCVCKFIASEGHRAFGLTQMLPGIEKKCECGFEFTIPVEYLISICFKMDGTVDLIKTFFTLMNETDFPNYKVFIAACHLCSRELVSQIWEKLSLDFHNPERHSLYNQLRDMYEFNDCALNNYWVWKCQEIDEWSHYGNAYNHNPIHTVLRDRIFGIQNHLLRFSLFNLNPYASMYFFQIITDEQKSSIEIYMDRVLRYAIYDSELFNRSLPNVNIGLFLISKLNGRDLQIKLLRKHIPNLIIPLISNLHYQNLLEPVIKLVWNSLDQNDFNSVCSIILKVMEVGCLRAKGLFFYLWNQSSNEMFRKPFTVHFCEFVSRRIDFNEDLSKYSDVIKLMLSECTDVEKTNYLQSLFYKKFYFCHPKDVDYLNVIDNLINDIFSSELEITRFKKFVVDDECFLYSLYQLVPEYHDSVNKLLDRGFISQSEINDYKQDYNFISGFVKSAQLEISRYEKADQFLNWCFNANSEMILHFKNTFAFEFYGWFLWNEWELFLKFVNWAFEKEVDKKRFKNFMSKFENLETEIWRIGSNQFEYINDLLNWCLTAKEIKKFKKKRFKFGNLAKLLKIIVQNILHAERFSVSYEFPSSCEMGEKLAIWFGPVGAKRIRKLKKSKRRIMRRLEHGNVLELIEEESMPTFVTWLDDFIAGLESHNNPHHCNRHKI